MYNGGGGAQEELQVSKEQSRGVLEQTWARVKELQEEEKRMSELLQEKEQNLQRRKLMKDMNSSFQNPSVNGRIHENDDEDDEENDDEDGDEDGDDNNLPKSASNVDGDVRIQLMYQEREEKILDIKQILHDKEILLQSLQDDTAEQQETIQWLQRILEEKQSQNGGNMEAKVQDKENNLADLEEELEGMQEELDDEQQDHLELEEEWHEREDLVADMETEAAEKLAALQNKLEEYAEKIATKKQERTEMLEQASEALEEMRQDFMEFMGPETSHNLVLDLRKRLGNLQAKEDELSQVLIGRLENKNRLTPAVERLEKLSTKLNDQLRKLGDLYEEFNDKRRHSSDEGGEDVVEQMNSIQESIASAFDESIEELTIRLDNMETNAEDDGDFNIGDLNRATTKLTYTIQARFRYFLRSLPDAKDSSLKVGNSAMGERQRNLLVESLESSAEDKKDKLKQLKKDLRQTEEETDGRVDKIKKKVDLLDDEIKFIAHGLVEKDRIITVVVGIVKERRDAEAGLMEELEYVYDKGIIEDNDFGESEKYLLEKLHSRKGEQA